MPSDHAAQHTPRRPMPMHDNKHALRHCSKECACRQANLATANAHLPWRRAKRVAIAGRAAEEASPRCCTARTTIRGCQHSRSKPCEVQQADRKRQELRMSDPATDRQTNTDERRATQQVTHTHRHEVAALTANIPGARSRQGHEDESSIHAAPTRPITVDAARCPNSATNCEQPNCVRS